jgi:transcriptional regulator with XRE-family HTH domain
MPSTLAYRAEWARRRRRLIAYGRWQPTQHTDPQPVRDHINNLRRFGLSVKTIAGLVGESNGHIAEIIYPNHSSYLTAITEERAKRYLAIRFDLDAIPAGRLVDASGTRRRIEALMHAGWSQGHIGDALGVSRQSVSKYRQNARVDAATARAVRDLYEQWWDKPGPEVRATNKAIREGFAPALAWDDDSIDDPAATPHDLTPPKKKAGGQGRPAEDVVEDIEFLLGHHPHATSIELAERLGYSDPSGVQNAIARARRDDLRAVLNRNAVLAGLNVTRRTA